MIKSHRFCHTDLAVEPNRYRLVVSPLCPWCRRVHITLRLLGLDRHIAVTEAVGRGSDGFTFATSGESFDTTIRAATIRELYRREPAWQIGEPTTVPVLIDESKHPAQIVCNESADLLIDFAESWRAYHCEDAPDLWPQRRQEILAERLREVSAGVGSTVSAIIHDHNRETNAAKLTDTLQAVLPWLSEETTLAHVALFSPLVSLVAETATTYLPQLPQLWQWYNERVGDPNWLSATEKTALFGDTNPAVS